MATHNSDFCDRSSSADESDTGDVAGSRFDGCLERRLAASPALVWDPDDGDMSRGHVDIPHSSSTHAASNRRLDPAHRQVDSTTSNVPKNAVKYTNGMPGRIVMTRPPPGFGSRMIGINVLPEPPIQAPRPYLAPTPCDAAAVDTRILDLIHRNKEKRGEVLQPEEISYMAGGPVVDEQAILAEKSERQLNKSCAIVKICAPGAAIRGKQRSMFNRMAAPLPPVGRNIEDMEIIPNLPPITPAKIEDPTVDIMDRLEKKQQVAQEAQLDVRLQRQLDEMAERQEIEALTRAFCERLLDGAESNSALPNAGNQISKESVPHATQRDIVKRKVKKIIADGQESKRDIHVVGKSVADERNLKQEDQPTHCNMRDSSLPVDEEFPDSWRNFTGVIPIRYSFEKRNSKAHVKTINVTAAPTEKDRFQQSQPCDEKSLINDGYNDAKAINDPISTNQSFEQSHKQRIGGEIHVAGIDLSEMADIARKAQEKFEAIVEMTFRKNAVADDIFDKFTLSTHRKERDALLGNNSMQHDKILNGDRLSISEPNGNAVSTEDLTARDNIQDQTVDEAYSIGDGPKKKVGRDTADLTRDNPEGPVENKAIGAEPPIGNVMASPSGDQLANFGNKPAAPPRESRSASSTDNSDIGKDWLGSVTKALDAELLDSPGCTWMSVLTEVHDEINKESQQKVRNAPTNLAGVSSKIINSALEGVYPEDKIKHKKIKRKKERMDIVATVNDEPNDQNRRRNTRMKACTDEAVSGNATQQGTINQLDIKQVTRIRKQDDAMKRKRTSNDTVSHIGHSTHGKAGLNDCQIKSSDQSGGSKTKNIKTKHNISAQKDIIPVFSGMKADNNRRETTTEVQSSNSGLTAENITKPKKGLKEKIKDSRVGKLFFKKSNSAAVNETTADRNNDHSDTKSKGRTHKKSKDDKAKNDQPKKTRGIIGYIRSTWIGRKLLPKDKSVDIYECEPNVGSYNEGARKRDARGTKRKRTGPKNNQ